MIWRLQRLFFSCAEDAHLHTSRSPDMTEPHVTYTTLQRHDFWDATPDAPRVQQPERWTRLEPVMLG